MTFKTLAAAALALTMAAPALAVPVEVDLIIDLVGSDSTTTLTLFGLDNGIPGDQAATSLSIRTAFDFYGPFAKVDVEDTTTVNNFNFIPGGNFAFNNLVFVEFGRFSLRGNNDAPNFSRQIDFFNCSGDEGGIACSYFENTFALTPEGSSGGSFQYIGFADVKVRELVAPVPLPAGGVLLFSALAGVAALKRRKTVPA